MFFSTQNKAVLLALALGLSVGLTACGGNGSDSPITTSTGGGGTGGGDTGGGTGGGDTGGGTGGGDTGGGTGGGSAYSGVDGPLDAIQDPLSSQLFGPLGAAFTGTPLEGSIDCLNQAVVTDFIDVLDAIAVGLQAVSEGADPQTAFNDGTANIENALAEFGADLPGAVTALSGDGCNNSSSGGGSENPLAGTPLEPLGDALAPILGLFPASGESNGDAQLSSLATLVSLLNNAFQTGMADAITQATNAGLPDPTTTPIFGGALTTLGMAINDLDTTMQAVSIYDGDASSAALGVTLDNLLVNILTGVVPIAFIENEAGLGPVFSSEIEAGVDQVIAALDQGLNPVVSTVLEELLNGALTPLMDPIENTVLPALLVPITTALAGGGDAGATGPTGTPLDALLSPINDALVNGSADLSGTPLDVLLQPLSGPMLQAANLTLLDLLTLPISGDLTACPLAGTPLDAVCTQTNDLIGLLDLAGLLALLGSLGISL